MNTYEAMFLFDSTFASDFAKVEQEVGRLMERAGAEIVVCRKWDERKLAYDIKGHKRGCYVLTFFRADPGRITGIERDAQLSEPVLRVLILRADHMTAEGMEAAYPSRHVAADRGGGEGKAGPEAKAPDQATKETEARGTALKETAVEAEAPVGEASPEAAARVEAPAAAPPASPAAEPAPADTPEKND